MPVKKYGKSAELNAKSPAHTYPFLFRRQWKIAANETPEMFGALQVAFSGAGPIELCVITDVASASVSPVLIPFSGALVPVCGIGYTTSGTDIYGNACMTAGTVGTVIAYGGDKIEELTH